MTLRATVLGLLLALLVAAGSHFNDSIVGLSFLVGNFVPALVFGVTVLLVLVVQRSGSGRRGLLPAEIIVVAALGLAGSGWAGNSFGRAFTAIISTPWHWEKTETAWRSAGVLSYLPKGNPAIAQGFVRDWPALATRLLAEEAVTPEAKLWQEVGHALPDALRARLADDLTRGDIPGDRRTQLLIALNEIIRAGLPLQLTEPLLFDLEGDAAALAARRAEGQELRAAEVHILSRALLSAAAPDVLHPLPRGEGLLLPYSDATFSAVDEIFAGKRDLEGLWPAKVPWEAWWPVLKVWIPLTLCFGAAMFCLSLIVHPQWADREKLAYPIARFISDLVSMRTAASGAGPRGMPRIFWIGLGTMVVLHLVNVLHAMDDRLPHIPLTFDLSALERLMPSAAGWRQGQLAIFQPQIYPLVVAFATLVTTRVAFTLGAATYIWLLFAVLAQGYGVYLDDSRLNSGNMALMRFGSYLGAIVMLVYIGRTYYAHVCKAAVGLHRESDTPAYVMWAARALLVATLGMVAMMVWAGLSWPLATLCSLMLLMMYLMITRVAVETGALYMQAAWAPAGVLVGLLGFAGIGPTQYLLLALLSAVFALNTRDILMPHLQHGLFLVTREQRPAVRTVAPWMFGVVAVTLLVTIGAVLSMQYHYAINPADRWPNRGMPSLPFIIGSHYISEAAAFGELAGMMDRQGSLSFEPGTANVNAWPWLIAGFLLFVAATGGRLKLPWWPLHPVLFIVWGSHPAAFFAVSFVLGWMIKVATVYAGGVRAYQTLKPLMYGVICGELLAGFAWMIGSAAYFLITGLPAPAYRVFPI